jgi:nitroreductase
VTTSLEDLEDLFAHQRAIRRSTAEHVDDALIERIIQAATRAPSARSVQPWRFIVVRDPGTKAKLGAVFNEPGRMDGSGAPARTRWGDVPVLIAVCSEYAFGTSTSGIAALAASIYPAVQNLLLASRRQALARYLLRAGRNVRLMCAHPRASPDDGHPRHHPSWAT